MKYIRRNDYIIFSTNAKIEDIDINTYKQVSDTIEELIDAYVFVSKSGETHYPYFKSYDMGVCLGSRIENDETFKNHLLENGTVYGAVWTDKGLIYVAKMNDKGCLELL